MTDLVNAFMGVFDPVSFALITGGTIFGIIFGITPEFHGKGVESGIMTKFWHFLEESQSRYKTMELAWIGDFNPVMNRMIQTYVCASLHKVHTTYRYLFDREKEFHRCPRLGVKRRE